MTMQTSETINTPQNGFMGDAVEGRLSGMLLTSLAEVLKSPEATVRRHLLVQAAKMADSSFREVLLARSALLASKGAEPEYGDEALNADLSQTIDQSLELVRSASNQLEQALRSIDGFRSRAREYVKTHHPDVFAAIKQEQEEAKNRQCECIKCTLKRAAESMNSQENQSSTDGQGDQAHQGQQSSQANLGHQGCKGCGKCKPESAETEAIA